MMNYYGVDEENDGGSDCDDVGDFGVYLYDKWGWTEATLNLGEDGDGGDGGGCG